MMQPRWRGAVRFQRAPTHAIAFSVVLAWQPPTLGAWRGVMLALPLLFSVNLGATWGEQ